MALRHGNLPLAVIAKDDPVSCTKYAMEHDLLQSPGWKQFARLAAHKKKLQRMINAAKRKTKHHGPIFKLGIQVPRNSKEARELDKKNGNTKWIG